MSRTGRLATLTAAAALALTACTGTTEDNPLTESPNSTTSAAPTTSSTSAAATTSTTTAPTGVEQAEQAVIEFYKQMDQLGQGKLDINKVTTWDRLDMNGTDTWSKWSKILGDQVLGQKILQVGSTSVSDLSGKEIEKPKSSVKFDGAYSVVACIDRSQLKYEKNGKSVEYNAGVATKTLVTHLVIENNGGFRVARDEPGDSC